MEWFIAVVAIAALGVAAMAAAGGVGEMGQEPVDDVYRQQLPDRALSGQDIRSARFAVGFRGYSMAQVDDLLERLAEEVAERDARIAELTALTAQLTAGPRPQPAPDETP
jgi:DivIVA domain-containing protein